MSNTWIDQMSQQMEHHEVEVPQGLWEGIEHGLEARSRVRRTRVVWMWRMGAAAAVAGIALGVLMLGHDGADDAVQMALTDTVKSTPQRAGKSTNVQAETILDTSVEVAPLNSGANVLLPASPAESTRIDSVASPVVVQDDEPLLAEAATEQEESVDVQHETDDDVYRVTTIPAKGAILPEPKVHHKARRVSMQFLAMASGGTELRRHGDYDAEFISPAHGGQNDSLTFESPRRTTMCVPARAHGLAYTLPGYESHDFPVKVGLAVRFSLGRRVAIDAGLSYARMRSALSFCTTDFRHFERGTQFANYVGVPLSLVVDLWRSGRWDVYAAGGGEVAKSVKTTWRSDEGRDYRAAADPWQFSVSAAVGAQFNVTEHVGLYAQPSADYYFDNSSVVRTYYSEHPFTPALRVGVRVNL